MKKLLKDKIAVITLSLIIVVIILGIFAPIFALHDPLEQDMANRFAQFSLTYPLGTDYLGRCLYSRIIYGIRNTVFLSMITMVCTIGIGTFIGMIAGYYKGFIDEAIMRFCDIMLSFPSQVMILAIVGVLGVGIQNIILANIIIKWTWYARMIRNIINKYNMKNYILFSKSIGKKDSFIISKHLLPNIFSEIILLGTLDMGWVIINISTLSFLGLGIQPPQPEWGAMLSEAKNFMFTRPNQMFIPGSAILILVASFNLLGDSLRDIFDPKEVKN